MREAVLLYLYVLACELHDLRIRGRRARSTSTIFMVSVIFFFKPQHLGE